MATRLKTVEYWLPELASVTDNTDTNFTQITVYLPENSKSFKSVLFEVIIQDAEATANNVNRRQVSLQLGSAGYSAVNNTNLLTASGEQKWIFASGDFTSYFNTNWSGTSMTLDGRILCDSAIATPSQNWRCATGRIFITYEYDDTSSTHVKTIRIPLNAPIGILGTSKPGTETASIPALDTYLPENGKTIRQVCIAVQGNEENASTTDFTMSWAVDSSNYTTGVHEKALNTACWYRHNQIVSFDTSSLHSWYLWSSVATFNHPQAWITVTYEFTISGTTSVLNSLILPMEFNSPAGGTTNADYQRARRELFIEEPGTITIRDCALFLFWEAANQISGMQYRVNGGAWSGSVGSSALTVAGGEGSMYKCDSYLSSFARGRNTNLVADIYRTDTSDFVYNLSSFWMINYTSGVATDGVGAHNHTVFWFAQATDTIANSAEITISAFAPAIPETNYFITGNGTWVKYITNTTGNPTGISVFFERLSGEGGMEWVPAYADQSFTDALVGIRQCWSQIRGDFNRWPNDADSDRLDFETSRRWRVNLATGATCWMQLGIIFTYHTITKSISGNISGSNGGTVNLNAHRTTSGEKVLSTSRSGNGAYSFTWYDDTEQMYVDAYEDGTHLGRSDNSVAS